MGDVGKFCSNKIIRLNLIIAVKMVQNIKLEP